MKINEVEALVGITKKIFASTKNRDCCHRNGTQKIATVSMVKKRCRPCTGSNCFGNWVSPLRRSGRCLSVPILWLMECGGI